MSQEENTVGSEGTDKPSLEQQPDPALGLLHAIISAQAGDNRDLNQQLSELQGALSELQGALDDKASGEAQIAENNQKALNVLLDNVTAAISDKLRNLAANGVIETDKAHQGLNVDILVGVQTMDCKSLVAFREFIVAGMAARRTSGAPGTDFVGL